MFSKSLAKNTLFFPKRILLGLLLLAPSVFSQVDVSIDYNDILIEKIDPAIYGLSVSTNTGFHEDKVYCDLVKDLGGVTLHLNSNAGVGSWDILSGKMIRKGRPVNGPTLKELRKFSDDCDGLVNYLFIVSWKLYAPKEFGGQGQDIGQVIQWLKNSDWPLEYWKHWRVGAEPYGPWDEEFVEDGAQYGKIFKVIADRIKELEPNTVVGLSSEAVWKPRWTADALKNAGSNVGFIDFHHYPHDWGKGTERAARSIMAQEPFLRERLQPLYRKIIEKNAENPDLPLHLGEYDFWGMDQVNHAPYHGRNTSLANALAWGDQFGYALKLGIKPTGGYAFAGEGSYGLLLGWQLGEQRGRPVIYAPKAWAMALWQKYFGDSMVAATVKNSLTYIPESGRDGWANVNGYKYRAKAVPYVTAYAGKSITKKQKTKASIILINKHPKDDFELKISLKNIGFQAAQADQYVLTTKDEKGLLAWQNRYNVKGGGAAQQVPPPTKSQIKISENFDFLLPRHSMVLLSFEE